MGKSITNTIAKLFAMIIAVTAAGLIATALMQPGPAYAAAGNDMNLSVASPMTTQAEKQSVWVISKCTISSPAEGSPTENHTFAYYKSGLVSKYNQTMIDSGGGKTIFKNTYSYNSKGNYTKWVEKAKYVNSSTWETFKYALKLDSKKRVATINDAAVSYNSKGHCASFDSNPSTKFTYNSKGLMTKSYMPYNAKSTTKYSRNAKGDLKSYKTTYSTQGNSSSATYKNSYKSGRLSSWTKTEKGAFGGSEYTSVQKCKYTWKKISVPKQFAAKVKAQQRWIVDATMLGRPQGVYPLVVVNK